MKCPSGLIVFDMDSTLIGIECIDEIARLNDCYTKVAEITKAAMEGKSTLVSRCVSVSLASRALVSLHCSAYLTPFLCILARKNCLPN